MQLWIDSKIPGKTLMIMSKVVFLKMQYFADVLPLALGKPYTYAVTLEEYAVLKPGFRVAVSFGKSKVYSAIVVKLHNKAPQRYTPKFIELILEESPSVTPKQLEFWHWLSDYYQSKLGDILRAALQRLFCWRVRPLLSKKTFRKRKEISAMMHFWSMKLWRLKL